MNKKVLLMILDGWGIAKDKAASAIDKAKTPFIDSLYKKYPHSLLQASGTAVGLPEEQMGNSEVGHMHIGAGRVVYQDLVKINRALKNGTFIQNKVLLEAFAYAKKNKKKIHLIGLLSDGGVHSHMNHIKAILSVARQKRAKRVFVHAFTDGRDTDPHSGAGFLKMLQDYLDQTTGKLATVVGRYFAMDRDQRWERTKQAYNALVSGIGQRTFDVQQAIEKSYVMGVSDEFIRPIIVIDKKGTPTATIQEGDVVISFNFRTDRARQITTALTQRDLSEYTMRRLQLRYITMTCYDTAFKNVEVIFQKENLTATLGEVISQSGKQQIRIAETEKYPHVTFFFSGGREAPYMGEKRILCPSPKVPTYDLKPEMSACQITEKIIFELNKKSADFVCLNFANPDMVGHTGVFAAGIQACETVDKCSRSVVEAAKKNRYTVIVTADHGNADSMINADQSPNTAHTKNPVPCILIDDSYQGHLKDGKLGDIAPTILMLMGLPIPVQMTGSGLLDVS